MNSPGIAMKPKSCLYLCACALALTCSISAQASVIYSNRAAWTSGVASLVNVGFEGLTPSNDFAALANGSTLSGVVFSAPGAMYAVGQTYAEDSDAAMGSGALLFSDETGISGVLPGGHRAFGVDLRGYLEDATVFDVTLSSGESYAVIASNPAVAFFGIVSQTAITGFAIDPRGAYALIDNVSFGDVLAGPTGEPGNQGGPGNQEGPGNQPGPGNPDPPPGNSTNSVPEPGLPWLLGIGLVGLASMRRRRVH